MIHFKDLVRKAKESDLAGQKTIEYVPGQPMIPGQAYDCSEMYDSINSEMRKVRHDLRLKLVQSELESATIILNS